MKPPADTIDLIRSTLQTGVVSSVVEQAAATYAQLSQDCAARLDRIAAMLENGNEHQALQAAEEEPPLLELVAVLSFGQEKAWLDFCQAHRLPIAPKLDAKTVQALDQLYAQGVTANHPLYKDFRAAVLSREDDQALRIIRTILKLNPGDENARLELARLENKHWQALLEKLRAALKTDDEERIASVVEKITATVSPEKYNASADFTQGEGIRRALRRRQAAEQIPALLDEANRHRGNRDWQSAGHVCKGIRELMSAHELELTPRQKSALDETAAYARREGDALDKRQAFDKALSGFCGFAQEAGTRLMTGTPPGLNEASALDEGFVRRWRELESYGLPVDDEVLARLRQGGHGIRAALESAQRRRRARSLMSGGALTLFLLVLAGIGWHGWQARAYALELSSCRVRQLAGPAARLVDSLRAEKTSLLHWPYLKSAVEETAAWVAQSGGVTRQAEQVLDDLEAVAARDFAGIEPADVLARLQDARNLITHLPADAAAVLEPRLAPLKTKADRVLASLGDVRGKEARGKLAAIQTTLKTELSYELPPARVEAAVQALEPQIAELEVWAKPGALPLPADLLAQIKAARQRVEDFKAELTRLDEVREATLGALTLGDFSLQLAKWQNLRFAEAAPAATTLAALPADDPAFLARLLTGGDTALLKASLEDASGPQLRPDTPVDGDLKVLLALRDDRHLNGIWENTVVDHSTGRGRRSVWSQGQLTESRVGDQQKRWSGKVYDPYPEDHAATFTERDYRQMSLDGGSPQGQSVLSSKPAAISTLIQNLQLDRMTDANGDRFERSLLSVFDRLMSDTAAPPLAKAHVMLELERLTRDRPFAWGMHLCPGLRADLDVLHRLLGNHSLRDDDWLVPKLGKTLGAELARFFQERQGRAYEKEAQARRILITRASVGGVKFGGYVETDRRLRLNAGARAASELWLLGRDGPQAVPPGSTTAGDDVLPLSPVLILPVNRAELLATYRSSVPGSAVAGDRTDPFLKP